MSFSLKTLLGCVAAISVSLVTFRKLHEQYYVNKLNGYVQSRDVCSAIELLQYGHDQGFRADWADDVLAQAAQLGDYRTIGHFRYTTNFNRKVDGDHTPLMLAAMNGHFNAAKFLLVHNVETNETDSNGFTASKLAMHAGHPEIAELISVAESSEWHEILELEGLLFELQSDGSCNRESIEELLLTDKYSALAALRTTDSLIGDQTGWYRVSESTDIGALLSNVEFIWIINGVRVNGVDYFYPPRSFN